MRTGIACCTSKGTITNGDEVLLTPDEVTHARENACTALFVVANVDVERADDGTVAASGAAGGVSGEAGDFLNGDAGVAHEAGEDVPQFAGCPGAVDPVPRRAPSVGCQNCQTSQPCWWYARSVVGVEDRCGQVSALPIRILAG
jgi:hypothetical protein